MKLGLAVSRFNRRITEKMEERAISKAEELGVEVEEILHVPGAYDLPLAVKKLLESDEIDAVATVGAVIKGDTDHDEVVVEVAAEKLSSLSLSHDKPVSLGISGPGMSRREAEERVDYAERSVESAVEIYRELYE